MDITLTTPALLFPAISLLLLAYTNRFLTIAGRIRDLHAKYYKNPDDIFSGQIENFRHRLTLIKHMQTFGVLSLFLCVFCMFLLFAGKVSLGKYVFGISLLLLMLSLGFSIWEIQISVKALKIQLGDLYNRKAKKK